MTRRDWLTGRDWFRLVSTCLDRFLLDWFRLVETGCDVEMVETVRDWLTLVSTGFDGFRPVFTGFLLVSTRFDW